jgi:hypothetical protein
LLQFCELPVSLRLSLSWLAIFVQRPFWLVEASPSCGQAFLRRWLAGLLVWKFWFLLRASRFSRMLVSPLSAMLTVASLL